MSTCITTNYIDPRCIYPVLDPRRTAGPGPFAYGYVFAWDALVITVARNPTLSSCRMTVNLTTTLTESKEIQGYNNTYARVRGLMKSDSLFDLNREPPSVRDRYGCTDFGQHALVGRRLIEAGVPMVKVARAWWDSHSDNFESRLLGREARDATPTFQNLRTARPSRSVPARPTEK